MGLSRSHGSLAKSKFSAQAGQGMVARVTPNQTDADTRWAQGSGLYRRACCSSFSPFSWEGWRMTLPLLDTGRVMGAACMHLQGTGQGTPEPSWEVLAFWQNHLFSKAEKVQGSCPLRDHWSPGFLWRFPGSLDIVGSTTTRARCTGLGSGSAPLSKLRKKRCWRLGISWLLLFKSSTKLFMQIKQHLEWHFSL